MKIVFVLIETQNFKSIAKYKRIEKLIMKDKPGVNLPNLPNNSRTTFKADIYTNKNQLIKRLSLIEMLKLFEVN